MTQDPRVDALKNAAILTDTQFRLTFAPTRPEARVVALAKEVRAADIDALVPQLQQGAVHIQLKAGFAPERHWEMTPVEMVLLYDMLDRFIHELPRVDKEAGK